MKEATSELSYTLIAIILGAILIAFFYVTVWPTIKTNFDKETQCSKAKCETTPNSNGMVTCSVDGTNTFECKYKG